MDDMLEVKTHRQGEIGIVTAIGEVDMSTTKPLREAVREIVAEGAVHLILDFQGVDYMDSSGMSIIMTAKRLAEDQNGKVVLIIQPKGAGHALELVKVYHMVNMAESLEDALKALGG